jgi:acyl-CoA synthetase (AMP-forming)/AMP-acid ligase II
MAEAVQYERDSVPSTIVSLLRMRAEQQPDDVAYTFVSDGSCGDEITYAELDNRARTVGCLLSGLQVHGKPVMLLCPAGIDYISAFFGCLYAGGIAVPASPPGSLRSERFLSRLAAIVRDAMPCVALTTAAACNALPLLPGTSPELSGLEMIAIGDAAAGRQENWEPVPADADSVALLNYDPGSVSAPKGVVLTHRNLISNSGLVLRLFGRPPESRSVIWLPPGQGMGPIGGIIQPLYSGFPVTLIASGEVLQRPLRWLQEISRTRAAVSGGPSFAYDLCVEKTTVDERLRLDLSGWQVAFNTSESLQAETIEQFVRAFEPAGFRREAFYPCYRLAEATEIVTGGIAWSRRGTRAFDAAALREGKAIPAAADAPSRLLVSCGYASADHCRVMIVDPVTRIECAAGHVGEIWVSGSSVAQSYWGRPDETREVFGACIARTGDGPFARSGDLGFMLDHELFVTGRLEVAGSVARRGHRPREIEPVWDRSSSVACRRDDAGAIAEPFGRLAEPVPLSAEAIAALLRRDVADCSGQRSVLILHELEPGTAQHRIAAALRWRGALDSPALGQALDVLVARRASIFPSLDGEPGQYMTGSPEALLMEHDACDLNDTQVARWLESAAHEPLDLAARQLARIRLYRRAADEGIMLIVVHHCMAEFWSITTLVRELETLYSEQQGGIPASLPELADFVRHYTWVAGARTSTYATVRGHEKVSAGGQVEVPGPGQLKAPVPRCLCPPPGWCTSRDGNGGLVGSCALFVLPGSDNAKDPVTSSSPDPSRYRSLAAKRLAGAPACYRSVTFALYETEPLHVTGRALTAAGSPTTSSLLAPRIHNRQTGS